MNYKNLDDIVRDIKLRLRKDKKLLETELKECLPINLEGYAGFAYEYKGNIIIMTKDFEDRPVDWNTLTHEIGHAVFKAARYIGQLILKDLKNFLLITLVSLCRK